MIEELEKNKLSPAEIEYKQKQELIGRIEGRYKLINKDIPIGLLLLSIERLTKMYNNM